MKAESTHSKSPATASRRAFLAGAAALGAAGAVAAPALAGGHSEIRRLYALHPGAKKRMDDACDAVCEAMTRAKAEGSITDPAIRARHRLDELEEVQDHFCDEFSDIDRTIIEAVAQDREDVRIQAEIMRQSYDPGMYDGVDEALAIINRLLALTAN